MDRIALEKAALAQRHEEKQGEDLAVPYATFTDDGEMTVRPEFREAQAQIRRVDRVEGILGNIQISPDEDANLRTYDSLSDDQRAGLRDLVNRLEDHGSKGFAFPSLPSAIDGVPAREMAALQKEMDRRYDAARATYLQLTELSRELSGQASPTGDSSRFHATKAALKERLHQLAKEGPDEWRAVHSKQFADLVTGIKERNLAITPSIAAIVRQIETAIAHGKPVILGGHTGTGKSELGEYVLRTFANDRDPEVIRGGPSTDSNELYASKELRTVGWEPEDVPTIAKDAIAAWRRSNPDANDEELRQAGESIKRAIEARGEAMQSETVLKGIARAMAEGRGVLVDEIDTIVRDLIKMNYLLTKRPGDTFHLQENGGEALVVKEGMAFIGTANSLGDGASDPRYRGRSPLDTALINRAQIINVPYPPQVCEGQAVDTEAGRKEIFQILVAAVTELRPLTGNDSPSDHREFERLKLELPPEGLRSLWHLSCFAARIQHIFAQGGKAEITAGMQAEITQPITLRDLRYVVESWKSDFAQDRRPLDEHLWQLLEGRAKSGQERALLGSLGQLHGLFSEADGWNAPNLLERNSVATYKLARATEGGWVGSLTSTPMQEVLEQLYERCPERREWPEGITEPNPGFDPVEQAMLIKKVSEILESLPRLNQEMRP